MDWHPRMFSCLLPSISSIGSGSKVALIRITGYWKWVRKCERENSCPNYSFWKYEGIFHKIEKFTEENIIHCPTCKSVIWEGAVFSSDEYVAAIVILQQDFDQWFSDLKTEIFHILWDPFSFDVNSVPTAHYMDLIDLHCFPELYKLFKQVMCLFASTYLCVKLFSNMSFNPSQTTDPNWLKSISRLFSGCQLSIALKPIWQYG